MAQWRDLPHGMSPAEAMSRFVIAKHWIKHPKRYPAYPSNGRMVTRIMVKLEGENVARRVYDTYVGDHNDEAVFWPCILIDGEQRMLSDEQHIQIGYDFHTCRRRDEE